MILFIDKCLRKFASIWRKAVFKRQIKCKHNDFTLLGKVTLINRIVKGEISSNAIAVGVPAKVKRHRS